MRIIDGKLELNTKELEAVVELSPRTIEKIELCSDEEKKLIDSMNESRNQYYHQLVWKLTGIIDTSVILDGYNRLLDAIPNLRTNYITNVLDDTVKVTYMPTESVFPIVDLTDMDAKAKIGKVISVAASEGRRIYNPKKSAPLRLNAFILKENMLAVVVSFIPEMCTNISRFHLVDTVFSDMRFEQGDFNTLSKSVNNFNKSISDRNVAYWKNELSLLGKELLVPGRLDSDISMYINDSSYKDIDADIVLKIYEYSKIRKISSKLIYLYAWMALLGCANDENNPSIVVTGKAEEPKVFPVMTSRVDSVPGSLMKLEEKFSKASKSGYIAKEDFDKVFDQKFFEHFHIIFSVFDIDELDENGEWYLIGDDNNTGIELKVRFDITYSGCSVNYTYDANSFQYDGIARLHDMYVRVLSKIVSDGKAELEREELEKLNISKEELKKKNAEEIFACLSASDIFGCVDSDMLRGLASKCILQNLSVDDELLREGDDVENVCIVLRGRIEENVTDVDGYVKSLRILKENGILGLEGITSKNIAKRTYAVASNEARVIWIPRNEMIDILNKNPECWQNILENVHEHLWKVEKMWMLQ